MFRRLLPPALLLLGIVFLLSYLAARRKSVGQPSLSAAERREAEVLLGSDVEGGRK